MRQRCAGGFAALVGCGLATGAAAQATQTESNGTVHVQTYTYEGQRNDAYQTRLTGSIDGLDFVFDETFYRAFDDALTRDGIARLAGPRGVALDGAPAVLAWDPPVLLESYEELVDSLTYTYIVVTQGPTVTTVQTTDGDLPDAIVYAGDRGTCYDTGATGWTNAPPYDGAFANCDGAEFMEVAPGTVNTNTHTTTVIETNEVAFTQYDFNNFSHWHFTGHATAIGHAYPATLSAVFDAGRGLGERLGRDDGPGRGAWAQLHHASVRADAADAGVAPHRRDLHGGSVGIGFAPGARWRLGVALDRADFDVEVRGAPESARGELAQGGLRVGFEADRWFAVGTLAYGRGDVDVRHGDASLGGTSHAALDVAIAGATARVGWRRQAGTLQLVPQLGWEWTRQRVDGWRETGGIALRSAGQAATRQAAWAGLEARREWALEDDRAFALLAQARAHAVLSGRDRVVPVTFLDTPDEALAIRGAREPAQGLALELGARWRLAPRAVIQAGVEAERAGDERTRRWFAAFAFDW
jgi:hypothetical protein